MKYWSSKQAASVPLTSDNDLLRWGPTLVLSPHPDDEALGCGGVIALLRNHGMPVEIAWFTDGSRSHPNSVAYPREKLIELRKQEALASATVLGVEQVHFFDLEDCQVPLPPDKSTVAKLRTLIIQANVVLTPWRRDPHCDHRAAYQYVVEAANNLPVQIIEYPIWVWQNGSIEDHPLQSECAVMRVAIDKVQEQKDAAVNCHRSQITKLISDDPEGFCIPSEMLQHFQQPWELFLTPI